MGTADLDRHASTSNAPINSNMDKDTVMTEPYSSSAPANNMGNSAPQQHVGKQQRSCRPRPVSEYAVISPDHVISGGTLMAVTKAGDPAGYVLYRPENRCTTPSEMSQHRNVECT